MRPVPAGENGAWLDLTVRPQARADRAPEGILERACCSAAERAAEAAVALQPQGRGLRTRRSAADAVRCSPRPGW